MYGYFSRIYLIFRLELLIILIILLILRILHFFRHTVCSCNHDGGKICFEKLCVSSTRQILLVLTGKGLGWRLTQLCFNLDYIQVGNISNGFLCYPLSAKTPCSTGKQQISFSISTSKAIALSALHSCAHVYFVKLFPIRALTLVCVALAVISFTNWCTESNRAGETCGISRD